MSDLVLSGPGDEMRTVTLGAVARIRDVLVWQTNHGAGTTEDFRAHPPIDAPIFGREGDERAGPVDLGRGLMIGRLERDLADRVMDACTPAGVNFSPHRQFGQRYSFIREVDTAEWDDSPYAWDRDHVIWDALLLSRLIRDNSCSTTYAARVVEFDNDERVIVYTLFPEAMTVYRVRRDRDWLDPAEGHELAELLAAYWEAESQGLPGRLNRAWGRTESASWQRTGDTILPVLVSGLECLLKTERHQATQQFVTRCQALAGELAIDGVTEAFLREMYDGRSDWIHGASVRLFEPERTDQEGLTRATTEEQWEVFDQIALLQQMLRSAVRRCFEDSEFRAIFSDDVLIRERWPL